MPSSLVSEIAHILSRSSGRLSPTDRASLGAALEALLYDRAARDRWRDRAAAFVDAHEMRATGEAARRAADAILSRATS